MQYACSNTNKIKADLLVTSKVSKEKIQNYKKLEPNAVKVKRRKKW